MIVDPATLICRVDNEYVKWFKDGIEMNFNDDEEIFIFPNGSLFFLSPRQEDTALYNCGYEEDDGDIVASRPPADIIVVTEQNGMNIEGDNFSDDYSETEEPVIIETLENKSNHFRKYQIKSVLEIF